RPARGPDAEPQDDRPPPGRRRHLPPAHQLQQRPRHRQQPQRTHRAGRRCRRVPLQPAGRHVQAPRKALISTPPRSPHPAGLTRPLAACARDGGVRKAPTPSADKLWRDSFNVSKPDLSAAGSNQYLPIQPGRVLKLKSGKDTLTITILKDTPTIDGVTVGVL